MKNQNTPDLTEWGGGGAKSLFNSIRNDAPWSLLD